MVKRTQSLGFSRLLARNVIVGFNRSMARSAFLGFNCFVARIIHLGFSRGLARSGILGFNPVMARARGYNPILIDYIFVVLLTMIVVSSLKLIGALLVLVLIVVPAAGAQNIARGLRSFFWFSVMLSTASTVLGLLLSGYMPVPTGGTIVLVASVFFYCTLLLRPVFGRSAMQQGEA